MDKQLLKSVMLDNQKEVQRYEVFKRDFHFEDFGNYVLIGIRRAGKSFLIYQRIQQLLTEGVGWDSMLYINFEDERLDGLQVSELNLIIEAHLEMYGKRPILFLDEIQNIEGWEKFARRLADEKYKVYITGSNAKMLSSDIQTTLGGRYITINVYPYSFPEFLEVHHTAYDELSLLGTESRAAVMNRFIDYFHNGGFPEGALLAAKRNYLTSVYQKIYLGDIAARNAITNTFGLKIMIKKLAESIKQPISFNRIANIVSTTGSKLSTTSAIKYVEYAESAWLLQRINNIYACFIPSHIPQHKVIRCNIKIITYINQQRYTAVGFATFNIRKICLRHAQFLSHLCLFDMHFFSSLFKSCSNINNSFFHNFLIRISSNYR